jgi:hypothetical protein
MRNGNVMILVNRRPREGGVYLPPYKFDSGGVNLLTLSTACIYVDIRYLCTCTFGDRVCRFWVLQAIQIISDF